MEEVRQVMKMWVYTTQSVSGSPSHGKGGGLARMDSAYNALSRFGSQRRLVSVEKYLRVS